MLQTLDELMLMALAAATDDVETPIMNVVPAEPATADEEAPSHFRNLEDRDCG